MHALFEVSDTLNNCIHCGYNLKVETDNSGNTDNYDKNIKSLYIIY